MLTELQVFNAVRCHLQASSMMTLQLVPPGGQAPLGITMNTPAGRRTCFPDLSAFEDDKVIVGELKPKYSVVDHRKISSIIAYGSAEVLSLASRYSKIDRKFSTVFGVLCHSQWPYPHYDDILQWSFDDNFALR